VSLVDDLSGDVTVITAGRRLTRYLAQTYAAEQQAAGRLVWEQPDILPLDRWVTRCWETLSTSGHPACAELTLLNPYQEQALWEQVVTATEVGGEAAPLLQVPAAAKAAREAWGLLKGWRQQPDDHPDWRNPDAEVFRRWADAFTARCARQRWLDGATLMDRVTDAVAAGHVPLPATLVLAGFDELTPQQDALVRAAVEAGCEVGARAPVENAASAVRLPQPDREAEFIAAARWTRQLLEAGSTTPIGVVVPDLAGCRADVVRVFEDVLTPAAVLPGSDSGNMFNVSLGVPLGDVPVVRDALLFLGLAERRVPMAELSGILRSPFLAGAEAEANTRAALDVRLRGHGEPGLSIGFVARHAQTDGTPHRCPQLAARFEQLAASRDNVRGRRRVGEWAAVFSGWLGHLGWPGDRGLDRNEYQAVEAFRQLLSDFAGLDPLAGETGFRGAGGTLRRMAAERVFQPQAEPAPVQILGTLEAAGLSFGHLWVTGLHDGAWPAAAQPNPFLPVGLQRRLGMPHASAERELEYARRVTGRLLASAPTVIVSYPQREGDMDLRPSPLVENLPESRWDPGGNVAEITGLACIHAGAPELENVVDHGGPPLAAGEAVGGGTGLFKDQAACPFRAFANHRLGTRALELPEAGLDARARGTLIHQVLEIIWERLRSHAALVALNTAGETRLVAEAVDVVLEERGRQWPETLQGRFLQLERERLVNLARDWLVVDRQRPPFEVLAPEQGKDVVLGGLPVKIRPDRIDRTPDGVVMVDYKTGRPTRKGWFGSRLDEPQLPVYAVTYPEPVAGIAYGVLRRGEVGLIGLGADECLGDGFVTVEKSKLKEAADYPDWATLLANWRTGLAALAEAFRAGDARVDPKDDGSCLYCQLHPFCRVHERAQRPLDIWEESP
jgi:ATP-dependent helicase/nuclease subunit B